MYISIWHRVAYGWAGFGICTAWIESFLDNNVVDRTKQWVYKLSFNAVGQLSLAHSHSLQTGFSCLPFAMPARHDSIKRPFVARLWIGYRWSKCGYSCVPLCIVRAVLLSILYSNNFGWPTHIVCLGSPCQIVGVYLAHIAYTHSLRYLA